MPTVWITAPRNLARLTDGAVMITGVVKPEHGDPLIRITDTDSGRVIAEEHAQTSTAVNPDGWLAWGLSAELPPGKYEVSARPADALPSATTETKTFEVS
ncbi:hypothetical protein G7085_14970 [Tessaracoccus sp. HDW20]|uniref:Gmad2 immunoglobulin-like domain-containing protein n=1 Tax=Tessaracoccus coleopterorum TaxID=2714950 RepID=UPI0018D2A6C4|nr:Gmad2 immunoglobulin-like domain-containing protein [Tessaracoccus coleopterorum]NHB85480.1 hypothetical protein [Tessaracoccus coleopterorum]